MQKKCQQRSSGCRFWNRFYNVLSVYIMNYVSMFCYVYTFTLKLMSVQKSVVSFWFWKPSIWVKCVGGGMVRGEVTNLLWSLFEHFRKVWLQAEAWSKICRSTYTILLHIESLQNKKCSIQSNIAIPKLTFGYHMSHVFEFFIAVTFRHFFFWTWNSCPITRVNFFPNRLAVYSTYTHSYRSSTTS